MSNKELFNLVLEQLSELNEIRSIPMMGGYVFYFRNKIFGGIYEDGFLVKITPTSQKFMPESQARPPYKGGKPMLPVTIFDDKEQLQLMIKTMYFELPEKRLKKKTKQ